MSRAPREQMPLKLDMGLTRVGSVQVREVERDGMETGGATKIGLGQAEDVEGGAA